MKGNLVGWNGRERMFNRTSSLFVREGFFMWEKLSRNPVLHFQNVLKTSCNVTVPDVAGVPDVSSIVAGFKPATTCRRGTIGTRGT
jgi:hypothetical protein